MKRLAVAVIGAGRIGKVHCGHILAHLPEIRLQAVADPELDERWAAGLGIPLYTRHVQEALEHPAIDAVIIAAPTSSHVSLIEAAARAGKDIFCEKPVAFEPAPLARSVATVRRAGVKLQVGFNRRFDPSFRQLVEGVRAGSIGEPHLVRIVDRDPQPPALEFLAHSGGIFLDLAIHDFDMARCLTGDEVEEVYATGAALIEPRLAELGDVDTAVTTLKLRRGGLCAIVNSRRAVTCYDQRIEVLGSKGSLAVHNRKPTSTVLQTAAGVFAGHPYSWFADRYRQAFVAELRAFFAAVEDDTPPLVDGDDALAAVRVACAAKRSCREKRPIKVAEIAAGSSLPEDS